MTNNETDTVIHRIPVTGRMDLLITSNGCIDILGGVDIQFMLSPMPEKHGSLAPSPISMEAAKEIFMSMCAMDQDRQGFVWSVQDQWYETYANAVESARRLREEGKREDENLLLRDDMPF
tara:strand:+ start:541 stop:900 length:360 start_codon:yes stop_codon:yes gene_type:complete